MVAQPSTSAIDAYASNDAQSRTATGTKSRMDEDGAASAYATPPVFPSGAAGLVSTVEDFLTFARMLLDGGVHGRKRLLSARSVRAMTSDQLTPEQRAASSFDDFIPNFFATRSWGYGVRVVTERNEMPDRPPRIA